MILLSYIQAADMLSQFERGNESLTSLDLGRTQTTVSLHDGNVRLSKQAEISLDALRKIVSNPDVVFAVQGTEVQKVLRFSEATSRTYKLRPTADWPALEISGILMHRIKATTPMKDAQAKLRLLAPVCGSVLDTCMGLGYTAILSAATADSVTVIEKDPNVLEMAQLNPHSRGLFEDPKIKVIAGDATEEVPKFDDASFDIVNHDPPTLSIAGELYANSFYGELLRIIKPGGKLLHYTGAPGSRGRHVDLNASVTGRLAKIGFARIRTDMESFCIVATRPGKHL